MGKLKNNGVVENLLEVQGEVSNTMMARIFRL